MSFLKKVISKFTYAFQGLLRGMFFDTSIALQFLIAVFVIIIAFILKVNFISWMFILLCIGIVIALEYMNSAIETLTDMVMPEYHTQAKKVKDFAAASVLIFSLISIIIACIIIFGGST